MFILAAVATVVQYISTGDRKVCRTKLRTIGRKNWIRDKIEEQSAKVDERGCWIGGGGGGGCCTHSPEEYSTVQQW
jgi:hypothetical protein